MRMRARTCDRAHSHSRVHYSISLTTHKQLTLRFLHRSHEPLPIDVLGGTGCVATHVESQSHSAHSIHTQRTQQRT
jgi:hypothetical protein